MKASLELRAKQRLAMTPQMRQALRLLQLSSLELRAEIQEALDSNIMLERADTAVAEEDDPGDSEAVEGERGDVDIEWHPDGPHDPHDAHSTPSAPPDAEPPVPERPGGLREHLHWQLSLSSLSVADRAVATAIIDAVDDDGYLSEPVSAIHAMLADELAITVEDVEAVLHRVQAFDPAGVAARDLSEALARQLQELEDTPQRELALVIVRGHLQELADQGVAAVARTLDRPEAEVGSALALVRTLDPRPGAAYGASHADHIVPDVIVRRAGEGWIVSLNPELAPPLRINPSYAALANQLDSGADQQLVKRHLEEARWLLKSLEHRNETLLEVAQAIVERQRGFLEHGPEAMRPLILRDIADAVGIHESTVSRVTTNKFLHTPRGTVELKRLFSTHVATEDGGQCAATAIHAMIRGLVDSEDPARPLSDNAIASRLKERGIQVARRTVAKYREGLSIPPASERKSAV